MHLCRKFTNQALSSVDRFTKDFGSGPDFVYQTHGLSGKEAHRLDVSGCVDVRRHTGEPLNRYLCTTNERAADDGFVGPGILGFTLAIKPLPDEPSSQRSVGSIGPSMPEKNSAYGVFLSGGHEPGFVDGMGIRFRSGEETRPHHDAVGTQAECSREPSCIGDTSCGQDKCGCRRLHRANLMEHRDTRIVCGCDEFRRISPKER